MGASPKTATTKASPKTAAKESPKVAAKAAPKKAPASPKAAPQGDAALNNRVAALTPNCPRVAPQLIWQCVRNNSSFIRKSPNMPVMTAERGNLVGLNSLKFSGLANKNIFDIHPVIKGKKETISMTTRTKKRAGAARPNSRLIETGVTKNSKKAMAAISSLLETGLYRPDLLELAKTKYGKIRTSFKKKQTVKKWRRNKENDSTA